MFTVHLRQENPLEVVTVLIRADGTHRPPGCSQRGVAMSSTRCQPAHLMVCSPPAAQLELCCHLLFAGTECRKARGCGGRHAASQESQGDHVGALAAVCVLSSPQCLRSLEDSVVNSQVPAHGLCSEPCRVQYQYTLDVGQQLPGCGTDAS